MFIEVEVRYFASLRSPGGPERERLTLAGDDARVLYAQLRDRFGWSFDVSAIRLAVNGRMVAWEHALANNDEIAFLPPFSGG